MGETTLDYIDQVIAKNEHDQHHHANHGLHLFLFIMEQIFKYTSFTIICLFMQEIIMKFIFQPKKLMTFFNLS